MTKERLSPAEIAYQRRIEDQHARQVITQAFKTIAPTVERFQAIQDERYEDSPEKEVDLSKLRLSPETLHKATALFKKKNKAMHNSLTQEGSNEELAQALQTNESLLGVICVYEIGGVRPVIQDQVAGNPNAVADYDPLNNMKSPEEVDMEKTLFFQQGDPEMLERSNINLMVQQPSMLAPFFAENGYLQSQQNLAANNLKFDNEITDNEILDEEEQQLNQEQDKPHNSF